MFLRFKNVFERQVTEKSLVLIHTHMGIRNFIQLSHIFYRAPSTWVILCCFPDALAGGWTGSRSSSHRECWHYGQWLNSLCHKATLQFKFLRVCYSSTSPPIHTLIYLNLAFKKIFFILFLILPTQLANDISCGIHKLAIMSSMCI